MSTTDLPAHLSVILDLSPVQWHRAANDPQPLPLDVFISHLLAFLNAHSACRPENTLAVLGAFPGKSVMLYSSTADTPNVLGASPDVYLPFNLVNASVVDRITDELGALSEEESETPIALVGAVTKALCYINRVMTGDQPSEPRILVLSASPDQSNSYIPIMNSIFSAQKLKVTIDVCQLYGADSVFLQQAAHLTGGSYVHLTRRDALLQYLMMAFLPPPSLRATLSTPTTDRIDFRAACFCHKRIVDVGFVCSVCLSIFCSPVPVCSTCRTKFPIKTLQRLRAAAPPQSQAQTPTASARPSPTSTPNGGAPQRSMASSLR